MALVDFDMFDVKARRAAKNRLEKELGLTPRIAVVAKEGARTQMPLIGVDQLRKYTMGGAPHGNLDQHHNIYQGKNTNARGSGNSRHNCTCMLFG